MLFGTGVIADRFCDFALKANYLIFAGSVNDILIEDKKILQDEENEIELALSENPDILFVYFSSCSVLDPDMGNTPADAQRTTSAVLQSHSQPRRWFFSKNSTFTLCSRYGR